MTLAQYEEQHLYWSTRVDNKPPYDYLGDLKAVNRIRPFHGLGVDLAAGDCWSSEALLSFPKVKRVIAIDYSTRRLTAAEERINSAIKADQLKGFFTTIVSDIHCRRMLGLPDFMLLYSTFHHATSPRLLLATIRDSLRRGGLLYILAERPVPWWMRLIWMKRWLTGKSSNPFRWQVEIDRKLGDYGYSLATYRRLFADAGFLRVWDDGHNFILQTRR